MTDFKKIGVLGGMGPEATVLLMKRVIALTDVSDDCLLYTSPSPRDGLLSRMPSSA